MNYFKVALLNFKKNNSLRHRASRAGSWTILGHFVSQVLRLGGNLALTRLLFPEAFGLMAIIQSVIVGISLFSDLGVESSIIRSKRGDDMTFCNTAWTMQVIKGVFSWLILCLIATPLASFYSEPMLFNLMLVAGFGAVLGGLVSTKFSLTVRALDLKKRVLIEIVTYAIGLSVTILWAWIDHSIWSLVWGGLIGSFAKVVASYFMIQGENNKFAWDRDSVKEIFGFGKWVLVSSGLTFLAGEGNKLIIGAFLGVKLLAFYILASTMSLMFWMIVQKVSNKVLFPAYSEVVRERPHRLKQVAARSRLYLVVPGWLIALFFVLWGDHFMWFLYDERYAESGNMLRLLGLGSLIGVISGSYNGLLWAKGMVKTSTVVLTVQITVQILGMIIGHHFLGIKGVVLSVAAVSWILYPLHAYVHARIGLWHPRIDIPFIMLSTIVVALNFMEIFNHG